MIASFIVTFLLLNFITLLKENNCSCQKKVGISIPNEPCQFYELIYDEETGQLNEMPVAGTLSTIGMVAWRVRLIVPEYPRGRDVIVIANDISHQIGSFSMREHRLYYEASRLSREKGLPRIYIAANSGARIGISADVSFVLH